VSWLTLVLISYNFQDLLVCFAGDAMRHGPKSSGQPKLGDEA
jgi:hypothetical protein